MQQLNNETFVLYLRNKLDQAPRLESFEGVVRLDHHSIEVDVPEGLSINELILELEAQDIVVERMRNKANRLEEVFVELTTKTNRASSD